MVVDPDLSFICEICGGHFERKMVHTCDRKWEACGPVYEERHHWATSNEEHLWWQEHNCVRPAEDDCWFCRPEDDPVKEPPRPACCVEAARTHEALSVH